MTTEDPVALQGISSVAGIYEGFIVDLFGVLHDGINAFPTAILCLERLRAKGKRIVLLSNSPRRGDAVRSHLERLGLKQRLYDALITSGELVFKAVCGPDPVAGARFKGRYFHLGPNSLSGLLTGSGRTIVDHASDADFVLLTGAPMTDRKDLEAQLRRLYARGLPMICANPDKHVFVGDQLVECAGAVAQRYQNLGGEVVFFGKPHAAAYRQALDALKLSSSSVLAVGDSIATDVMGATGFGLDAALVTSGIHRAQLSSGTETRVDQAMIKKLLGEYHANPRFVLEHFIW